MHKSTLLAELVEGCGQWTKPWAIPIPGDSASPPLRPYRGFPTEGQQRRKIKTGESVRSSVTFVGLEIRPAWSQILGLPLIVNDPKVSHSISSLFISFGKKMAETRDDRIVRRFQPAEVGNSGVS